MLVGRERDITEKRKLERETEGEKVGNSKSVHERHTSTGKQKVGECLKCVGKRWRDEALILFLDLLQMFLNSWHSRVINSKWNRNWDCLFLWCFHSEHSSVLVSPLTGKGGLSTLFWVRVSTSCAAVPVKHFTCTNLVPHTQWVHIHTEHVQHVHWHVLITHACT